MLGSCLYSVYLKQIFQILHLLHPHFIILPLVQGAASIQLPPTQTPFLTSTPRRDHTQTPCKTIKKKLTLRPNLRPEKMPPRTITTAPRLPPLPKLRVRRANKAETNPCVGIMSSVLGCWASSGYSVTGCAELEKSLRECMDVPVCLPSFCVCLFVKRWGFGDFLMREGGLM